MAIITLRNVSWGLGGAHLIDSASFSIAQGDKICLLGRNGVGKSTLLKILEGRLKPDTGDIWRQQGTTVSALAQEVLSETVGTIFEVVARGMGQVGWAIADHHRLCAESGNLKSKALAAEMEALQRKLDNERGWALCRQIEQALSRVGLDPEVQFQSLSAGMKRRALFCRAIARQPDLLLLDEPTNHLDIDTIVWLENYLQRYAMTLLFVSHDRAFAQRVANRVFELDRGRLSTYACDYQSYLKRKQTDQQSETKQAQRFNQKLSQEESWIRQGIKARRTRNQGRVRALQKMRQAYRDRRRKIGNVRLQIQDTERTGKLVIAAQNISYAYDDTSCIKDLTIHIMRGDKIGLIGPNGIGKSTLLKLLLKEITPTAGSVRHGTKLQVAYFDQLRNQLDDHKSVQENIGEGNDYIIFNGDKRHTISYLQDFLFTPDKCRTPVHILSGGEKNRLLLAKLFARPANVLILDEPTNDLDVETLELLEELLFDYSGTLLMVSHDRSFLNNVVTSTLAFEGNGKVIRYPGGYDDWLDQRPKLEHGSPGESKPKTKPDKGPRAKDKPRKLGYMEQRELETLPQKIEDLETEQQHLFAIVSDPDFYKKNKSEITTLQCKLTTVEAEITAAYERWEQLENKGNPQGPDPVGS